MTLNEAPGVTGTLADTLAAAPPSTVPAAPPCPPSATIVTKQMSAGTVAAPAWNPDVVDANNEIGAALADPIRPQVDTPAATTATPNALPIRFALVRTTRLHVSEESGHANRSLVPRVAMHLRCISRMRRSSREHC
jgi:hypothetical protein